jgi:hypothetical protein
MNIMTTGVTPNMFASAGTQNQKFNNPSLISHMSSLIERYQDAYDKLDYRTRKAVDKDLHNASRHFVTILPELFFEYDQQMQLSMTSVQDALLDVAGNAQVGTIATQDGTEIDREKFAVCRSIDISLADIVIDTSMQRDLDLKWVSNILSKFRETQLQPIHVYRTKDEEGRQIFAAWDGQHTAVVYYVICVLWLKMNIHDVKIPANIYKESKRGQMRETFISLNTKEGKKKLEEFDLVQQKIYGVVYDSSNIPDWKEVHKRWKVLSDHGVFLGSADLHGNMHGSVTRIKDEITNTGNFGFDVIEKFAWYCEHILDHFERNNVVRPIHKKEIPIVCNYLQESRKSVSDTNDWNLFDKAHMKAFAQYCIDMFDADFDEAAPFWEKITDNSRYAWEKEMTNRYGSGDKSDWSVFRRNVSTAPGINFLWHQLKFSDTPFVSPTGAPVFDNPVTGTHDIYVEKKFLF